MLDDTIYVLDASSIIAFKQVVKAKDQWGFAKHLEEFPSPLRIRTTTRAEPLPPPSRISQAPHPSRIR